MIRSLPFLFFPLMLCCQNVLSLEESIGEKLLTLSIAPDPAAPSYYHLYFEHESDKRLSRGLLIKGSESLLVEVSLFPGRYRLYIYGLAAKTEETLQVVSFYTQGRFELFSDRVLDVECLTFTPSYSCEIDREQGLLQVLVTDDSLEGLFRLSSLSLKQGESRVKGVKFSYDKTRGLYTGSTPLEAQGECYLNLSYTLKGSFDRELLKERGLSLSTTYFKGLFLCRL